MADEDTGREAHLSLPHLRLDELLAELQARIGAVRSTRDRAHSLLNAVVMIGTGLDLETMLRRIVEAAMDLVDARYGALGVVGDNGELQQFIPLGLSAAEIAEIAHWPRGNGILGLLIKEPHPLRLHDLSKHPESHGFPAGHPPMRSFLGVPIRVRDKIFGNLYLSEKAQGGDFDEDDEAVLVALATAAGVAIENARLFDVTRRREQWLDASDAITTRLLTGARPDEVLHLIAQSSRRMSESDMAAIAVPQGPDQLTVTVADGPDSTRLDGRTVTTAGTLTGRTFHSGESVIADLTRLGTEPAPLLSGLGLGPVLLVPLGGPDGARGVLALGRRAGAAPYTQATLDMHHAFAGHAAVALELAEARRDAERLSILEDRDRIAKDLHDHIIQRLFATAMSLMSTTRRIQDPAPAQRVQQAVDDLDDTIRQIRSTIFALQTVDGRDGPWLRNRILDVVNAASETLGFPVGLRLDGPIDSAVPDTASEHLLAALREALSNVARHARASGVDVRVAVDSEVSVSVEDDGVGIPADATRSGLRNLAERAASLGGSFELAARPAGGTRLRWSVPLHDEPA